MLHQIIPLIDLLFFFFHTRLRFSDCVEFQEVDDLFCYDSIPKACAISPLRSVRILSEQDQLQLFNPLRGVFGVFQSLKNLCYLEFALSAPR